MRPASSNDRPSRRRSRGEATDDAIVDLLAKGCPLAQISEELGISLDTVSRRYSELHEAGSAVQLGYRIATDDTNEPP